MTRITARPAALFLVVVDESGCPVGTVTDGDIRRALLDGHGLDEAVTVCMNASPMLGRAGDTRGNRQKLKAGISFLPVVDESGILCEIIHQPGSGTPYALVMAGGFGTRLGDLTKDTPKPLLPVGGKPMLAHVFERLEQGGIRRIFVSTHYLADQIRAFVADWQGDAEIEVVHEDHPLGTAGALGLLPADDKTPVLVVNADVLTKVNFRALIDFHGRHGFDGTIAVTNYETRMPFGVVRCSDAGLFDGIEEKPVLRHFVAAGIYYLSPEILSLVPGDRPLDMPELLNIARRIGLRIGLFPIHEYWIDIGRPDDLNAADRHQTEHGHPPQK